MAQRVNYPVDNSWGMQISNYAAALSRAQTLGARLLDALNSMAADGAGPFDQMESELNLEPGSGMPLYQVVNEAQQSLVAIDIAPIDHGLS